MRFISEGVFKRVEETVQQIEEVLASGYIFAVFMTDAPWKLTVAICISSAGVGIGYAAMPSLIMKHVPRSEASSGVGANTLMRSIGSTTAGAVMAIVLTSMTMSSAGGGPSVPSQNAFQACFIIGAAAALVAVVLTLLIPRATPRGWRFGGPSEARKA